MTLNDELVTCHNKLDEQQNNIGDLIKGAMLLGIPQLVDKLDKIREVSQTVKDCLYGISVKLSSEEKRQFYKEIINEGKQIRSEDNSQPTEV